MSQYLIKLGNKLNQGVHLFVATDNFSMIIEPLLAHFLPAQEKRGLCTCPPILKYLIMCVCVRACCAHSCTSFHHKWYIRTISPRLWCLPGLSCGWALEKKITSGNSSFSKLKALRLTYSDARF